MGITGGEDDNAFGTRKHLPWIDAFVGVGLEVGHLAVMLLGEPFLELCGAARRIGRGEAAEIEAQFARALLDGVFHLW